MAYINMERNRAATLAAVGALHVGVIYALVVGLAGPVWKMIENKPFVGEQIPLPQPPPDPAPTPEPEAGHKPIPRDPAGPLPLPPKPQTDPVGSSGPGEKMPVPLPPIPPPPLPEMVTPKLARPMGHPGLWVTQNDFPSADLRAEHQGVTRFQLSIGVDGRVQSCRITVSSGFASLDTVACTNLAKRAKFAPATDNTGAAVASTYSSAVRWTIPKD